MTIVSREDQGSGVGAPASRADGGDGRAGTVAAPAVAAGPQGTKERRRSRYRGGLTRRRTEEPQRDQTGRGARAPWASAVTIQPNRGRGFESNP